MSAAIGERGDSANGVRYRCKVVIGVRKGELVLAGSIYYATHATRWANAIKAGPANCRVEVVDGAIFHD
jgi:hypothetical protein